MAIMEGAAAIGTAANIADPAIAGSMRRIIATDDDIAERAAVSPFFYLLCSAQ